jgi:hypothetical protein
MVSRQPFTCCISLALELDTKILILFGTCGSCLFTSKVDFGKVVLRIAWAKK